ncbi:TetR/AcrR family transcriptional regulator [Nocardia sp. NPDC050406]|uniref:TetR/AcrR family transcriptional regulator n=1 Tax=Nocardia sp. NPDC050406 TaxID=3364318 RepID=UPI0037A45BFA
MGRVSTRTGRPPRLSRDQIVAAARELVAAHGVEALTMRRLATELGATPMALYRHVRDREELLLLLLDDVAATMLRPDLPDDPRERMVVTAVAMHDTLARVPWIVEVLTGDEFLARSALWYAETIVDAAMACGGTEADAVYAYRSIWYYTAGELIIRATARRPADGRTTFREKVFADLDAEELPRLAALGERYPGLAALDTYECGLRALVAGLFPTS